MDSLLDELKHFSGEHNTCEVYMIHSYQPVRRCICVNVHLGIPLMYGLIIVYKYIYIAIYRHST